MIKLPNNLNESIDDTYDCDRILLELHQKLIEEEQTKNSDCGYHKTIINNIEKEDDNHSSTVNIIINKFTKNFVNSQTASDVIQSSLEYNNYLINKMLENSNKLSESEYDYCSNVLWKNLKILSRSADYHVKSANLLKNDKYCQIYSKVKSKETSQQKNLSGLIITIDKSILEEFPENYNNLYAINKFMK